jgi:crotonobetainyl-CoA:carnitine CoA-transferase CaiB-like acyl-CoA transferase
LTLLEPKQHARRGACEGLRVVDFSCWMAGPLATMVLADNGADVIKVEAPDGDPARELPAFQTWNRGKKSIVLDLKTPSGRAHAEALVLVADVVLVAFRPGVAERLGIGYEQVKAINDKAVYAAISGYGDGQKRHLKGYEGLVAAKSGRMMMFERVTGRGGPGFTAVPCASFSAAMLTVQGILAALHRRRQTNLGQKVSISLLASLLPFDSSGWIARQLEDREPGDMERKAEQTGVYNSQRVHRPTFRVPRPNYTTVVTKDGVWLQFANSMDRLFLAQMMAMELVYLYGDERFAKMPAVFTEADSEALWEIIFERTRSKTYAEWCRIFEEYKDLAVDRFLWPLESTQHRQVVHNGHVVEVPGLKDQSTLQPGSIVRFSESNTSIGTRAPRLGEHTQQLLAGIHEQSRAASEISNSPSAGKVGDYGKGPLADITIIDVSTFFAAPYATSILANLGARVIKVEPPGGEQSRYSIGGLLSFPTTQGKQSIAVDLRRPEGQRIVHLLIERADMLLHNFRPGVVERLGIDYPSCRRLNPRIIYLNAAAYGESGPDCARPAMAPSMGAVGGTALRQVGRGHPLPHSQDLPLTQLKEEAWRLAKANEWSPDPIGAFGAATALMLGLQARDGSGVGQSLLTTMLGSLLYANSDEAIAYEGRPEPPRVDGQLYGTAALYRLYRASEGWVFLACLRLREWEAFCRTIRRPDLVGSWTAAWLPETSSPEASGLAKTIGQVLSTRSAEEWQRLMSKEDVPLVAVETREPGCVSVEDEEMRELGYMVEVESQEYGRYWRHGGLQQFSEDASVFGPWEPVGGHTLALLKELGFSPGEIDRLTQAGVVEASG